MTMKKMVLRPNGKKEVADDIVKRCEEDPRRYFPQIRRLARYDDLIAKKSRKDGRWYFTDYNNWLKSPEQGLADEEALKWLLQE